MDPIVIVGGGIVGTSLAYHLREAEPPVVLLEKGALGSGTTGDSIAQFCFHQSHPDPVEHSLRMLSWEEYGPLIDQGRLSYGHVGTLQLARTAEAMAEVAAVGETLGDYGIDVDVLDAAGTAAHGIDPDAVAGGLFVPADGYLDPSEIVQYYVEEATAAGVEIRTGVEVTDVRTEGGNVTGVATTDGDIDAGFVVNAAGPWAPRVNEMVDVSLPLRHTLGPILVLQNEAERTLPFTFFEDGVYFRGEGATQAFAGSFATDYADATERDPDAHHSVDQAFRLQVADRIEEAVPALADAEVTGDWVGVRTVTPDGRPFVGETRVGGYYVAVGMSGYGVTRAPAVALLLAEHLMAGNRPTHMQYMSPRRKLE